MKVVQVLCQEHQRQGKGWHYCLSWHIPALLPQIGVDLHHTCAHTLNSSWRSWLATSSGSSPQFHLPHTSLACVVEIQMPASVPSVSSPGWELLRLGLTNSPVAFQSIWTNLVWGNRKRCYRSHPVTVYSLQLPSSNTPMWKNCLHFPQICYVIPRSPLPGPFFPFSPRISFLTSWARNRKGLITKPLSPSMCFFQCCLWLLIWQILLVLPFLRISVKVKSASPDSATYCLCDL